MSGSSGNGGFTVLYRRVWSHGVFRRRQEAAVFVWMISEAQWQAGIQRTHFGPVALQRGELLIQERALAEEFGLHRNTLRSLIQRMVDAGMIDLNRDRTAHRAGTIVTVRNYEQYQSFDAYSGEVQDRSGTELRTEAGPKEDRSGTAYKDKQGNQGKEGKEGSHDSDTGVSARARAKPNGVGELSEGARRAAAAHRRADPHVLALIERFDASLKAHFGTQARPWPAATDRTTAERLFAFAAEKWGMEPQEVLDAAADLFAAKHARVARNGGASPKSLKLHEEDLLALLAQRRAPTPQLADLPPAMVHPARQPDQRPNRGQSAAEKLAAMDSPSRMPVGVYRDAEWEDA